MCENTELTELQLHNEVRTVTLVSLGRLCVTLVSLHRSGGLSEQEVGQNRRNRSHLGVLSSLETILRQFEDRLAKG